jgi:carbonic anhydrase
VNTPDYEQLFENNRLWVESELAADPDHFERLAAGQSPDYLFIGCSDSRVNANEMVGMRSGQMFIHRNIANLVVHTDMNLMSVLQFAVEVLEVEHVIVCGHYGCGGVAAAVDGSYHGLIDKWLRTIKDVYRIYHVELDAIADPVQRHQRLVELNVREQVYRLCSTSFVQRRWGADMGEHVHGWVYDLRHGLLTDLEIDPADEPARRSYELDGLWMGRGVRPCVSFGRPDLRDVRHWPGRPAVVTMEPGRRTILRPRRGRLSWFSRQRSGASSICRTSVWAMSRSWAARGRTSAR